MARPVTSRVAPRVEGSKALQVAVPALAQATPPRVDLFVSDASPSSLDSALAEDQPPDLLRLQQLARPFAETDPLPVPDTGELKAQLSAMKLPGRLSALEAATALGHPSWAPALESLGFSTGHGTHFLLAARLALFMERSFKGATLEEVARMFLHATPGAADTFGAVTGDDLRALQRVYAFMPQWEVAPGPQRRADDWFGAPTASNLYTERLTHALEELNKVSFDMPITRALGRKLSASKPFAHANVVMVQHVLGQASTLMNTLVEGGLDPRKAEMIGIPYQGGQAVKVAVEAQTGVSLHVPETGDIEGMWRSIGEAIDRAVERHRANGEPILVMDDGGYAAKYVVQRYPQLQSAFRFVEQTTRGLTELSMLDFRFPVVNVAGSYDKRLESAQIGDAIISSVERILESMATSLNRRDVLVLGAGKVGLSTARAAKAHGAGNVVVYDPFLSPRERAAIEAEGFRVITDKAQALREKFLVVGTSGHQSIDLDDFKDLASNDPDRPVFAGSGSSKRVEIDHYGLLAQATDAQGRLQRVLAATVNDQQTYHYWLNDGRLLTMLADDLPVNFQDVNSVAPRDIDHVMASMVAAAEQALRTPGTGLVPLEEAVQFEIQAQDLEIAQRAPSEGELSFKVGERVYSGTFEQWQQVATSIGTTPLALAALYEGLAQAEPNSREFQMMLSALGPPHELSSELIQKVLDNAAAQLRRDDDKLTASYGLVAVSKLMGNDSLTDGQRAAVSEFVQARLNFIGERSFERLKQASKLPDLAERMPLDSSVAEAVRAGTATRTIRTTLLLKHALTDPRVPRTRIQPFLDDPQMLRNATPANIFVAENPNWTGEELTQLASRAFERGDLVAGKPTYARYLYDLAETFHQHPNSPPPLRDRMLEVMRTIRLIEPGTSMGRALWPNSIGEPLPVYVNIPRTVGRMDTVDGQDPRRARAPERRQIELSRRALAMVVAGSSASEMYRQLSAELAALRPPAPGSGGPVGE